jgi:hypothetical protein
LRLRLSRDNVIALSVLRQHQGADAFDLGTAQRRLHLPEARLLYPLANINHDVASMHKFVPDDR